MTYTNTMTLKGKVTLLTTISAGMVSSAIAGDAAEQVTFEVPAGAAIAPAASTLFGANPYGSIFVGGDFNESFDGHVRPTGQALDIDLEDGISYGLALGVQTDLLGGTRFEVEGFYSNADVDSVALNGRALPTDGNIDTYGFSLNMIKDFTLGAFSPYVGAGIGYTRVKSNFNYRGGQLISVDDSDGAFTYKFIGGIGYAINEQLTFFTEYNYNVIGDLEFDRDPTNTTADVDGDGSHDVRVGLRYSF